MRSRNIKVISIAVMVAVLFGFSGLTLAGAAGDSPQTRAKGDINGNGYIDITDYIIVRLTLLGTIALSEEERSAADVDENGVINATDYIIIRLHLLGIFKIGENPTAERINAMYSPKADKTNPPVNALAGASYTYKAPPSDDYPDPGNTKLTDGDVYTTFDTEHWAGLYNQANAVITFDLGSVTDGLADLRVTSLCKSGYGVGLAASMDLFISDNGTDYTYVSTSYPAADAGSDEVYYYELKLQGTVSARYVRLSFGKSSSVWFFLSEVEFFKYPATGGVSYYGTFLSPEITNQTYWDANDKDYSVTKNMLSKLSYQIKPIIPIGSAHQTDYYNTQISEKRLTDGSYATLSNTYQNPAYFHFTQSEGRLILFDLGALSTVTSFSGEFLKQTATGIAPPSKVAVYVSEDGVNYGKAGETSISSTSELKIIKSSFNFDKKYKARYVIVFLQVSSHVWCSEIEVFGTKKIDSAAVTPDFINYFEDAKAAVAVFGDKDSYLMPEDFLGVNNVMLSYHCLRDANGQKTESGLITLDEYLPYVGYYDKSGKLKDTFMDGFLYLPYTAYNYSDYAKTLAGWNFYIDNQFTQNRNVDALNKTVGQVKGALNRQDYKVSVFFSILYTFPTIDGVKNNFGDVDGDGKNEDFATVAGRKKAVKWIIDEQIARFNSSGYQNLELKGFYWFEESAGSDPQDREIIRYASDYLHEKGYVLFWIPWYRAQGYEIWESFGFDAACMQPNYAFNDVPVSRLYDNAAYTKSFGMCVEFESNGTSYASVKKIKEYLIAGEETGYMHAVKMYYQGGVPGDIYNAYKSNDAFVRSAYDEIYLYSKGLFTKENCYGLGDTGNPVLSGYKFENGVYTGKVAPQTSLAYRVTVSESPKYGTLKLSYDGSFVYTPASGFKGVDSFSVVAENMFSQSEPVLVVVRVN